MQEKKSQTPITNIQMMRVEPCEEELNINIVTHNGITTGEDKGKQLKIEGWVCKAMEKEVRFDLKCAKENFMEAKNSFVEASTSGIQDKSSGNNEAHDVDPSLLATFLKTCMKLLRDRKAIEGL